MPVLAAFIASKNASNEVKLLPKIVAPVDPGLLQNWNVLCSLKCFGNDLICWQLIGAKTTKRLPCLLFKPTGVKHLAASTF